MIPWRSPNPLVNWPHAMWVRADSSDGDSLQSQIHEDEYGLRRLVGPGDVVVDCGAYIGAVSALALSLGAYVYAVEPLKGNVEMWTRNTAFASDRSRIYHGALSSSRDLVPVRQLAQDNYGHRNRFVTMTAPMRDAETTPVEMVQPIDINDVLATAVGPDHASNPYRIKLLKIDIEGAEWDVLPMISPANLARVDNIAMEIHAVPPPQPGEDHEVIRRECFSRAADLLRGFRVVRTKHNDIFLERA